MAEREGGGPRGSSRTLGDPPYRASLSAREVLPRRPSNFIGFRRIVVDVGSFKRRFWRVSGVWGDAENVRRGPGKVKKLWGSP